MRVNLLSISCSLALAMGASTVYADTAYSPAPTPALTSVKIMNNASQGITFKENGGLNLNPNNGGVSGTQTAVLSVASDTSNHHGDLSIPKKNADIQLPNCSYANGDHHSNDLSIQIVYLSRYYYQCVVTLR